MRQPFTPKYMAQTGGPFGSLRNFSGYFAQPANPWVHARAIAIGQIQPTSATLAGQPDSCCSSCANNHRSNGG